MTVRRASYPERASEPFSAESRLSGDGRHVDWLQPDARARPLAACGLRVRGDWKHSISRLGCRGEIQVQ